MTNKKDIGRPLWQQNRFGETNTSSDADPLAGFANIMDVMLVFALGLLIALMAQSRDLQAHFKSEEIIDISQSRELAEPPPSIRKTIENSGEGMEPLGQVYRDPETNKLILIKQ
ncbi:MAG: DUF2149 domain-containing protein [Parahaliea sp.]